MLQCNIAICMEFQLVVPAIEGQAEKEQFDKCSLNQ